MTKWLTNNWIEITGASLALIYLFLEIKQKWSMWLIGIISSAFYIFIFFQAKLYAEMWLNVYYAIMSAYGLYCWKFIKTKDNKSIETCHITLKKGYILLVVSLLLFVLMSYILIRYTDSPVPYPDALIAALSITATWMVTKKIIEHWYVWIFTNFFSIGLYIYRELYPTALLFIIYGCMSIVGLIQWKKSIIQNKQTG